MKNKNDLTLDLYIISRLTHIYYTRELAKIGLTMGEFPFLTGVAEHDGISQEKLSEKLMISKSTTTVMVGRLCQSGLIVRELDPSDRRNFRLHITEQGKQLLPQIHAAAARCHKILLAGFSAEEKTAVLKLNRTLRENAEAAGWK